MAANTINYTFPIYYDVNGEKTPFNNLVLRKVAVDSVVMSLGDKITGEVYYPTNSLIVTMQEYVEYKGVRYVLVSPPTILREGLVSDNSELKGMTKYSFTFYHPMCQLSNMPFTDVAVSADETKYLSQSGTFSWTGTGVDFIAKLNKNLQGTEWIVVANENDGKSMAKLNSMPDEIEPTKAGQKPNSNVLSFDNVMIADALKTCYDTWKVPFIIDQIKEGETHYSEGKRYLVLFGLPSNEILDENDQPYVFRMGQGVGLKNNSRNPKNNKIITRIAGYGSTDNIQYGYPHIVWTGDQSWNYTINNASGMQPIVVEGETIEAMSYPIYDGFINGQKVRLIQHPFTRDVLMPSIYRETVNKKVNPLAQDYDPRTELKDYYDALNETYRDKQGNWISFFNTINSQAPSYQKQGFDGIKPRLQTQQGEDYGIVENAVPYEPAWTGYKTFAQWQGIVATKLAESAPQRGVRSWAHEIWSGIASATHVEEQTPTRVEAAYWEKIAGSTTASVTITLSGHFFTVKLVSSWENASWRVLQPNESISDAWDDTYDAEKDEYVQSYFNIKLPQLNFDLYACASVTQEMKINMRSGACQGCTFPVEVDWEDYKKNFYKEIDGKVVFDPVIHTTDGDGHVRDGNKYPDSSQGQITLLLKKEIETFGTLMPNIYQQPKANDKFVILGISLPQSYVTNAEALLDETMMQYMLENNVHYFDYPLKFDEHFLATHQEILAQMRNNTIVRFKYPKENGVENALYIKQMTIKYGDSPLPQYDITLTDDVEIVLNQIGQVTDDVSRMRVQMNELQKYYGEEVIARINEKLSKVADDVAQGRITFQQGLDTIGDAFIHGTIGSPEYQNGLYGGRGWRIDNLGNAEMESLRVRSYLEIVELLVNRMQAQEGDTMFSDNDQIDKVDKIEDGGNVSYILSLKERWNGYITSQQVGNILKGIINTLAAKQSGISDVSDAGAYYTSWMRVVATHNTDNTLGVNQIRVVLYGDKEVPAKKNFTPCELMALARWGNVLDPYQEGITESEKARRLALRSVFYISTSEGRITKLNNVGSPILLPSNYGTTLGELPDFVKKYSAVASRLVNGGDYLYAQGIVVGDFIKIDKDGYPLINNVDKGEWQNNTVYLHEEYNEETQQYETHDVWHNNALWRCLQHQPVTVQGITTYFEPMDGSEYWLKLMGGEAKLYSIQANKEFAKIARNQTSLNTSVSFSFYTKTGDATREDFDTYFTIYTVANNGVHQRVNPVSSTPVRGTSVNQNFNLTTGIRSIAIFIWGTNLSSAYVGSYPNTQPYLAKKEIPILKDGDTGQAGERGKVGRFYYYSGFDWDASNVDDTFVVNDAQVPYFSKAGSDGDKYYVFNREETPSGGEMTMAQMAAETTVGGAIQWNKAPWEVMADDFKYLITQAIFAQFAQFGSAIISGDWMLSTNGTINGVAYNNGASYNNSPAYTWFDPQYPNESVNTTHNVNGKTWSGYNFVPNYAVDLLTGSTYQHDTHITGGIFVDKVSKVVCKTWLAGPVENPQNYYLYTATEGAFLYDCDHVGSVTVHRDYYSVGKITLKSNHFFILASGINDSGTTYYSQKAPLHIKLPNPRYCIGQSIVITNKSTGFPPNSLLLEQEYVRYNGAGPRHDGQGGTSEHYVCTTAKELLHDWPNYPYGNAFKDGEPVLGDSSSWVVQEDEDYTKEYTAPMGNSSINGIWMVGDNNFPNILTVLDLNEYEWIELVAVGWNIISQDVEPSIVDANFSDFNTQWMVTRWEKKSNS